jgi:ATP-dependent Clp protease ATP-binding subunit ClpC
VKAIMFTRFTDHARKVMTIANQEAMRFNRDYIGTEHILLGLVKVGSGRAVTLLNSLEIDLRRVRIEVEKRIESICQQIEVMERPPTPRAKSVIEYALEEMQRLGQSAVGTEQILLGLLREQESIAAQVLNDLGLDLERVRNEVRRLSDAEEV